jgi:hypothetical protein
MHTPHLIAEVISLPVAVEVYSTIERILAHPKAWPVLDWDIRRSLVEKVPFCMQKKAMQSFNLASVFPPITPARHRQEILVFNRWVTTLHTAVASGVRRSAQVLQKSSNLVIYL